MKGLESKFEEIYKINYSKVMRLCLGYVNGDSMLAKDLAQEVFIKVWEHLESFRNESVGQQDMNRQVLQKMMMPPTPLPVIEHESV